MFRVHVLIFWRENSELESDPGTRVGLGCQNLEFGPGLMNNMRFDNDKNNKIEKPSTEF